jgi:hypothetical protein
VAGFSVGCQKAPARLPFGAFEEATFFVHCSPFIMSSRADMYRQRAADAKKRAAQAKDLSAKKAFEEVARGWLVLAEQMEWIDRQRSTLRDEENDRSLC